MNTDTDPVTAPPPEEIPLPQAPLVRVIAQVRFSPILAVQQPKYVASFQEALRDHYPVLHQEHAQNITLGGKGASVGQREIAWRFGDADDAWRVSLTPQFVALETTAYSSRGEFLERMQSILDAAAEHVRPGIVQRIGLRYIDRVTGAELDEIADLVRPEMLGIARTPLQKHTQHALSDALLAVPDAEERIRMRWGHLPAHATVDANALEPVDEKSWILDIDMFADQQRPFDASELGESLRRFAERIYTVFRWVVTEEFLRRYGGTP